MNFLKVSVPAILAILLTVTLILVGLAGMVLSYLNPVDWILPHVNTCYAFGCWGEPTLIYLDGIIKTLNANWIIALPVSVAVLFTGLIQPESRKGFRSIPPTLTSAYKKLKHFRDIVFEKIDYLNSESAKWRRAFTMLRSPYIFLTKYMGLSPQMAISFLAVGGVATSAVTVDQTLMADKCFSCGDHGEYNAPNDKPIDKEYTDNTLGINLGAVPVREIILENISTGEIYKGGAGNNDASVIPAVCDAVDPAKAGNAKCAAVIVSGKPAVAASGDTPAFVATRITIGTLIVESSRCKFMTFESIDAHSVIVDSNFADGISIYKTAGTAPNRTAMGGFHMANSLSTTGGTYDRIVVAATTSGVNGRIGTLKLSNVYSKGGQGCVFKNLDIGTLKIVQNEVGHDSSLLTKEFQIKDSVLGANWSVTNNVELILPEPAIENANP